jgi:hypothetical protein
MKIYHYSKENGEYMGSTNARLDPLELELGRKKYLMPINSTVVEPPVVSEKEVAIFNSGNDSWSILPDYRGDVEYDPIDGASKLVAKIDIIPGITEPPPKDLINPKWDLDKWVEGISKEDLENAIIDLRSRVAHATGLSIEAELIQELSDAENKLLTL